MLKHVDLSACEHPGEGFLGTDVFGNSGLESIALPPALRVIERNQFICCKHLKSVSLGKNSVLEEIESKAFYKTRLRSFVAPPSLRKIGDFAFGCCGTMKRLELNEGIQEVGRYCFWDTRVKCLVIPPQASVSRRQLGLFK